MGGGEQDQRKEQRRRTWAWRQVSAGEGRCMAGARWGRTRAGGRETGLRGNSSGLACNRAAEPCKPSFQTKGNVIVFQHHL